MKKGLLLIPGALLPYVLLAILGCLFGKVLPANILDTPSGFVMIAVIILYGLIAFWLNGTFTLLCIAKGWNGRQIAKINMIIKLAQIPAYIAIFVLGLICFITIFTFMFTVFFVLFDCFAIFLSGMVGASAAFRRARESKSDLLFWFVIGFLQFIFIADVVSCIILYAMKEY